MEERHSSRRCLPFQFRMMTENRGAFVCDFEAS
jgi:hypothetical protein